MQSSSKPRVIILGCGNVGQRQVQFCARKGWPIVAAYNRAGDKVGQDLGRLSGLGKDIGVLVEDFEKIELSPGMADIAVIATTGSDFLKAIFPACERFLRAGINVVCHGSQAHNPLHDDPETAKQIDSLARENNVTFAGATIWDNTRVWSGILAASNSVEIESIVHRATGEPGRQNPLYEAGIGIGLTPEEFSARYADTPNPLQTHLHGPPVMVLQNLGCRISSIEKQSAPIVLQSSMYSPHTDKEYPAGVVGGVQINVRVETEEGITALAEVEYRLFEEGETELMTWKVNGLPRMEISITRDDAANLSAASLFNRIPDVISAPAGIAEFFKNEPGLMRSTALV